MRNIFIAFVIIFSSSSIQAQAWYKDGVYSPGAFKALHKVWGEHQGYTSMQETAEEVTKIYNQGQFESKLVYNSGVKPDGSINFLTGKQMYFQVTYLGTTDATLLNGPVGYTAELYLKKDCRNLCWIFLPPSKEEEKKEQKKYSKTDFEPFEDTPDKQCNNRSYGYVEQQYIAYQVNSVDYYYVGCRKILKGTSDLGVEYVPSGQNPSPYWNSDRTQYVSYVRIKTPDRRRKYH